ncbi:MAG: PAS domain-containing protein [Paracoccaceae bacterium]
MTQTSSVDGYIEQVIEEDAIDAAKLLSSVVCSAEAGTPVLYVSEAFEAHTGYSPEVAVGQNLSFLQGPETEPESVAKFRELIANGLSGVVRITNYRADGSLFVHECDFRPVRDEKDAISHFVAIQRLVS